MRKRPSKHGIEKIRIIGKVCSNCKKPLSNGESILIELDSFLINCSDCIEKGDLIGPEEGGRLNMDYVEGEKFIYYEDESSMDRFEEYNE